MRITERSAGNKMTTMRSGLKSCLEERIFVFSPGRHWDIEESDDALSISSMTLEGAAKYLKTEYPSKMASSILMRASEILDALSSENVDKIE